MRTFPAFKQAALTAALVASLAFSAGAAAKTFHWSYQGDASSMDPMALNETSRWASRATSTKRWPAMTAS